MQDRGTSKPSNHLNFVESLRLAMETDQGESSYINRNRRREIDVVICKSVVEQPFKPLPMSARRVRL